MSAPQTNHVLVADHRNWNWFPSVDMHHVVIDVCYRKIGCDWEAPSSTKNEPLLLLPSFLGSNICNRE